MKLELWMALERVARRIRGIRLWSGLTLCWIAWAASAAFLSASLFSAETSRGPSRSLLAAVAVGALATAALCALRALRSARDPLWIARQIEARHPELSAMLLAAAEQAALPPEQMGYLQTAVINRALEHGRRNPWEEMVAGWKIMAWQLAHVGALALFLVSYIALASQARPADPSVSSASSAEEPEFELKVEPGDTELERGAALLVVARFGREMPSDVTLVTQSASTESEKRPMSRSLDDPAFAARVPDVQADLSYYVAYDNRRSDVFKVKVFEYPAVERVDAQLAFPKYTGMPPKTVEDIRHVTAVEGTELTLICRLNKPIARGRLLSADGEALSLASAGDDQRLVQARFKLAKSQKLKVELVDNEGRKNKTPVEIAVNVTENHPASVTMTRPTHDVQVSPLEELKLTATVEDDFGVVRHGLSYTTADGAVHEVALGEATESVKKVAAAHMLDFEALQSEPDQLVTYFFWAEDIGPDEKPRRTDGDMYFAEVRPFEEIFRQGEQPTAEQQRQMQEAQQQGAAGGAAEQANELAELQKQIINSTWKVVRRETGDTRSGDFAEDAKLLVDSQQSAIDKAAEMAEQLQDPKSMEALEQAVRAMGEAFQRLEAASDTAQPSEQRRAIAPETAAYQALLKLRAREFEVTRGNQSQQGGASAGGGNRSQRQLNELELTNDENRYETQSQAQSRNQEERQQEQQETRQVLNRLRELAQRQADLNERVREMQSALEAAESAEQKEEIERQLKRLREQQQQILRDTDELQDRMQQEQNRERLAQESQQLQDTRENVREASEALEQGRVSEALTEGTRASRQLEELRDRVREKSSGQFTEEMTEMRETARELDERQQALHERLDAMNRQQGQPTLRDGGERAQAKQELQQQGERLNQLLEQMQSTVQEAEQSEPLLAQELFDTVQNATERRMGEAMEHTERMLDFGNSREASRVAQEAGEGIQELREGVERAAENVLPDETEALRRADRELEQLAQQLNQELPRAERTSSPGQGSQQGEREQGNQNSNQGAQQPEQSGEQGQTGSPQDGQQDQRGQQGEAAQQGGSEQQGQQSPQGQSGQQGSPQQSQQPGQQGTGQSGGNQPGQQEGQSQQGQGQGQTQSGQQNDQQGQGGQTGDSTNPTNRPGQNGQGGNRQASFEQFLQGLDGGANGPGGPITGEGFRAWTDRMREVEELIDDPQLRAEAARIRDRVRGEREEFRRHSQEPDPNKLRDLIAQPLDELRSRIREQILKQESPDALVPIDRDPVPPQFSEGVRRYYERLGSGE